jgi:DNA polymerase-3 subunit delta'
MVKDNAYTNVTEWLDLINAENKQGNINANECRHLMSKLQLKSFEGGKKILIMWLPEFLGNEGNILLKLIEEPPANTIMIFATENYEKIIATIQSRTQLFNLLPLSDMDIKEALVKINIPETTAVQIARTVEGNYNEALKLTQNIDGNAFDLLRNWLNALFTNNTASIVSQAFEFAELGREKQKQFLNYFISILEHLVRLRHVPNAQLLLQANESDLINKLSQKKLSDTLANDMAEILNNTIYHIERNANAKITFTGASNKLMRAIS